MPCDGLHLYSSGQLQPLRAAEPVIFSSLKKKNKAKYDLTYEIIRVLNTGETAITVRFDYNWL